MRNSYDLVTHRRRAFGRVALLVVALCAIFAGVASATQGNDVSSVVVGQAALQAPAGDTDPVEDAQDSDVGSDDLADAPVTVEVESVVEQDSAEPAPPSEEVLELVAEIEARDEQIAALEEQLAVLRQEELTRLVSADEAARGASSFAAHDRLTPDENATAMLQWQAGYELGGGQNFSAFVNTILPCESGTQPNPDIAVGRTDDWGRAQINRPTWKDRFETLTGVEFEQHIVNPVLNGYMAAHVEQEQGLSAWTCWRNR